MRLKVKPGYSIFHDLGYRDEGFEFDLPDKDKDGKPTKINEDALQIVKESKKGADIPSFTEG